MSERPWLQSFSDGLRCVLAPNPSPMTAQGTNTYLVGRGQVAVIDPGPDMPAHLDRVLSALGPEERIVAILVTHAHRDHSGLCTTLSNATGAKVGAAGAAAWGRSPMMRRLARSGDASGGEGVDQQFQPDFCVRDGAEVTGAWGKITGILTPGHMGNHMCFAWKDALFSGDTVMGWASSLISPPDGDMSAYLRSLACLECRSERIYYPGHGAPVHAPRERVRALIAHRRVREREVMEALANGQRRTSEEIAQRIYPDLTGRLFLAATRTVFAHLIDLAERGLTAPEGALCADARFRRL